MCRVSEKQRLALLADLLAVQENAGLLPCGAGLIVFPLGGLKPPASAGSFQHEHVALVV